MEHTKRHNINREYMKLEVWSEGMTLYRMVSTMLASMKEKVDFRTSSQLLDAAQSVSANIAEGYCRRSINKYLYFVNVALGSLGELMTRIIGLKEAGRISDETFESFDEFHYRVENKLLALMKSLQAKRHTGEWQEELHESIEPYTS